MDRAGFVHGPLAKKGENVFMATYFTCPTRLPGYDFEPPASFAGKVAPSAATTDSAVTWSCAEETLAPAGSHSCTRIGSVRSDCRDVVPETTHTP